MPWGPKTLKTSEVSRPVPSPHTVSPASHSGHGTARLFRDHLATSIPVNALADLLPSLPSSRHLAIYCFLFCWILLPRGSLATPCLDAPLPWRLSSILSILQFMCCLCCLSQLLHSSLVNSFSVGVPHSEVSIAAPSSDVTDILRSRRWQFPASRSTLRPACDFW